MAKQRRSFRLDSNLKTRFSLRWNGIRSLLDSCSCGRKVMYRRNHKGYAVCSLETLTRLHSSTWGTKWFKRIAAYAKCNRDSYEREKRLFYRHFIRSQLLQLSLREESNTQGSLLL
ncbi:hypothetical protein Tco_1577648 [Tanacetum coccineum]